MEKMTLFTEALMKWSAKELMNKELVYKMLSELKIPPQKIYPFLQRWKCIKEQKNLPTKNHIIFFSGGLSSFSVADFVKQSYPNDNILLYFTDTLWENEDLYRFILEASDKLELPLLIHSAGLTPIQLMFEQKVLFNSRIGACSKILKMKVASDFIRRGIIPKIERWYNPQFLKDKEIVQNATLYFGISFEEMHRQIPIIENWKPFRTVMPLIDHVIDHDHVLEKYQIKKPLLYELGFSHNNCNGRCVKAGQGHFKHLQETMPNVFQTLWEQEHYLKQYVSAYHYLNRLELEGFTHEVRDLWLKELDDCYRGYFYGEKEKPDVYIPPNLHLKQYAFLKRTVNKEIKPFPLRDMVFPPNGEIIPIDRYDISGCGCFVDYNDPVYE